MRLAKVWLIARREYVYNFTRKSFLFTAFVIPLLIGAVSYGAFRLAEHSESSLGGYDRVGVVDRAGVFERIGERRGEFRRYVFFPTPEAARAAFDAGEINAYFIVPDNYLRRGELEFYGESGLRAGLQAEFGDFLLTGLLSRTPQNVEVVRRLHDPIDLQVHLLGEDQALTTEAMILRFVLPVAFGIFFLFNAVTTSQFLMTGVVEEKENRIIEILITSCRPLELLAGKVIGLGALSITQMIFWLVAGVIFGGAAGFLDVVAASQIELRVILFSLLYFLLGFLFFAGIMVGIGASTTAEQESRQIAAVFVLLAVLPPSWGAALFITNPNHPLVTAMSLFPFTSPLSNMALLGLGEVQPWRIILSLLVLIASIIFVLWFSARIFRVGMLSYGQRLSLRQLRNLLRG